MDRPTGITVSAGLGEAQDRATRLSFVRRAGAAAAALATGGILADRAGGATGRRDALENGLSIQRAPATDAPNTWTADQTFMARLGVGTQPVYPLHVVRTDVGAAVAVTAHSRAFTVRHDRDWAGETHDLVDLDHRSAGDAIFIAHRGGRPPAFSGETGGMGGVNVLVPYYIDDTGTGRAGSVVNDRTGARALFVQTQPTTNDVYALYVSHWSNAYAAYFAIQQSPNGEPQGTGGGILMDDYSASSSLKIGKWTAPRSGEAIVNISARTPAPVPGIRITETSGVVRALVMSDGTASFGTGSPFAVRLQSEMPSSGVARNLALSNSSGASQSGTQIEFDDHSAQYALITATFDQNAVPRAASLKFSVRAADVMTERLRLSGAGIGFFGAAPGPKPVVSGARGGNPALASLLGALASLGLVTDSTTS